MTNDPSIRKVSVMGLPELLRVHKSILDHVMFINFVYRLRYSWSIPVTILYTDNEYVSSVVVVVEKKIERDLTLLKLDIR